MTSSDRRERYAAISGALSRIGDADLRALLGSAEPLGSGIGGDTVLATVESTPVFVKRIRLTDLERTPGLVRSTANVFELPTFCHYGIGSPGFGAWREVAAHELTTEWVLDDDATCFPLAYHWRVMPAEPAVLPAELRDVDAAVRYWNGSAGVRARIEGLAAASAAVLMFLEYVPDTLDAWLNKQLAAGEEPFDAAYAMVERELHAAADLMAAKGFLHLDGHFENVLTDGTRIYLADLGLALSKEFDLARDEHEFFGRHGAYDRSYVFAQLSGWLTWRLDGTRLLPGAARIVDRYQPVTAAVRPFYRRLQTQSRRAEYPVAAERAAWEAVTPSP